MNVVFLGPPGAGKGTQAERLSNHFQIPNISTGEMLRQAMKEGNDLGRLAQQSVDAGELVDDAVMIALVKQRVAQDDCKEGFLLDGFPRTVAQARALQEAKVLIDWVIEIVVDVQELVARLGGRRIHPASGRIYHLDYNPPRQEGLDDLTGEPLIQRQDDQPETIAHRLDIYKQQTAPVADFYQSDEAHGVHFMRVDGNRAPDRVTEDLLAQLKCQQPC